MLTGFIRNHIGIVLASSFIVASWLLPILSFWASGSDFQHIDLVAIALVVTMVIGLEIFFIQVALSFRRRPATC